MEIGVISPTKKNHSVKLDISDKFLRKSLTNH